MTTQQILNNASLLQCIQNLHMCNTGSFELSKDEYDEIYGLLYQVKENWQDGLERYKIYDDAVFNLLNIVLEEKHWFENKE